MKSKLYCLNLVISKVQRLFVFTFSFLFLSATFAYAQSEKFATEIKKEDAKADASADLEAHAKLDKHPNAKDVHYFRMGNIANVQKKGLFDFTSPVTGKTIHAMTTSIRYQSDKDYIWYGTVSDSTIQGDMILISENSKVYGHLNFKDESYHIYGVGYGISAFLPAIKKLNEICPKPPKINKKGLIADPGNAEVTVRTLNGVCPNPIRVLVLYSRAALAYDPNILQTANTCISQFNQALQNCGVSNGLATVTLAGIKMLNNFTEGTGYNAINDDVIAISMSGGEAAGYQDAAKADIVILLTNGNYQAKFTDINGNISIVPNPGTTKTIEPVVPLDAYCIAEDYSATSNYTFAHELGHIFGGKHIDDNTNTPNIPYAHGYPFWHTTWFGFGLQKYSTLMVVQQADYSRIMQFANPNVTFLGEVTGTTSYANVVQRINETANTVANIEPAFGNMTASISGNYTIDRPGCNNIYTSDVTCGTAPYSYQWSVSADGFTYYSAGTNSSASVCIYKGSSYDYYHKVHWKLQVTSYDGQTTLAYFDVNIGTLPMFIRHDNSSNTSGTKLPVAVSLSEASPNPSTNESIIQFSVPTRQNVKLELFNELGTSLRILEVGEFEAGIYETKVNAAYLTNGLYFYKLSAGDFQQTKKLLISK